ncbi:MAG: hypothetical protein GY804_10170 [Alphaproteobacteria bacterium]|nr:hypothetical protein [Alphaproteobacteria bacterium]
MAEIKKINPIDENDMDSLFVLPLDIIPLETPALKSAKLIKNHRLESVLEIFSGKNTGSGQVNIPDIPKIFGWKEDAPPPDFDIIRKLSRLPSYDTYSLRVSLREQGIIVDDINTLKLSDSKNNELNSYMTQFTRPLILQIYSDENIKVETFKDVIKLFRDPDIQKAKQRLEQMSEKLGIEIEEVPIFLEDYADIFLSLSYYRNCLDNIVPIIENFFSSIDILRSNWQIKQDVALMQTCEEIESTLNETSAIITGRFESFDKSSDNMWDNISAETFQRIKNQIETHHTSIGGILCSLTAKMNAWAVNFPDENIGGPVKRSEFIMSELKPGIDKIKQYSATAEAIPLT